jgi:choline dehydrogenase
MQYSSLLFFLPISLLPHPTLASPTYNRHGAYDYIVVGSGPGGGPLASRLARAGFNTLLIEAGNDQGNTSFYQIPGFSGGAAENPAMRWDMFVNHFRDHAQAERDPKYVYGLSNGTQYIGLTPPAGATPKGVLYPRAGTLGGCSAHNALIWISMCRNHVLEDLH